MNSILTFKNVTKLYGKQRAINNLSIELPETGIVGLIGRNGAGKTTLLNLATGLILPTAGTIEAFGEPSAKLSDSSVSQLGVVPHRPQFIESQTVEGYLELIGQFYATWDTSRVTDLLDRFELDPSARIGKLSEGQKQKLSIVVATGHHPRLLLLDEPMSNLDPISRASTIKMLWDMLIDDGVLIILSSHILHDIEKIADHVVALDHGKLLLNEPLDQLNERFQRWQILDASGDLISESKLSEYPGFIGHSRQGTLDVIELSQAHASEWINLKQSLNGQLESKPFTLDEIFQYTTSDAKR